MIGEKKLTLDTSVIIKGMIPPKRKDENHDKAAILGYNTLILSSFIEGLMSNNSGNILCCNMSYAKFYK